MKRFTSSASNISRSPTLAAIRSYRTSLRLNEVRGSPSGSKSSGLFQPLINFGKRLFRPTSRNMGYVVVGVSGITCGGKTTLTKLLQKKFPQAVIIHQDHYFYDDDYPGHIRVAEVEGHVNYEIFKSLDMDKMFKDVEAILKAPPKLMEPVPPKSLSTNNGFGDKAETPNFDENFLKQVPDLDLDVSKYNKVPILIIEGFTMFASQFLFEKCDARFFCSLDQDTCRQRRSLRGYNPPDTPGYFDKVVWPEYVKHFENYIDKRPGITVFNGCIPIEEIWRKSVEIVICRIEEKLSATLAKDKSNNATL